MPEAFIKHQINNRIAEVEFYNPKANSFESEQLAELSKLIDSLSTNQELNAIVLKSSGDKVFCAGAAFHELVGIDNSEDSHEFFMGFGRLIHSIVKSNKIIIAAVKGKVVGGGVGIVSACDYALAAENAQMKLSEMSIGIGPFVIEPAIKRKVGLSHFSALSLDPSAWKSADWAFKRGFYQQLHKLEDFDAELDNFINQYQNYSPPVVERIKAVLREGTEHWAEDLPKRAAMSGNLLLEDSTQEILKRLTK